MSTFARRPGPRPVPRRKVTKKIRAIQSNPNASKQGQQWAKKQSRVVSNAPGSMTATPTGPASWDPTTGGAGSSSAAAFTPTPSTSASPPPTLPTSEAARQAALANLTASKADLNRRRYMAALQYGDKGLLSQFKEYGPVVDNPMSELSTIAREEELDKRNLREGHNEGRNTFFSGLHLRDLGQLEEGAGLSRSKALQNYQQSKYELTQQIAQAQREYDEAIAQALAEELEAAEEAERVAAGTYDSEDTEGWPEGEGGETPDDFLGGLTKRKKKTVKKKSSGGGSKPKKAPAIKKAAHSPKPVRRKK